MCFFHFLFTKIFKRQGIQCEAKWLIAKKDFDIPSFVGRVDGWKFECKKQRERGFHILLQTTSTSTKGHDQEWCILHDVGQARCEEVHGRGSSHICQENWLHAILNKQVKKLKFVSHTPKCMCMCVSVSVCVFHSYKKQKNQTLYSKSIYMFLLKLGFCQNWKTFWKFGVTVSAGETRKAMTVLTDAAGITVAGAGAGVVLQNPTPPTPKPSSKILLAEDNKVNIMVAQSMLKRLGYSLEVVGNGADVIQALKQSTYDLILMVSFFCSLMHSLFSC